MTKYLSDHYMYAKKRFVAVSSSITSINNTLVCAHCMHASMNMNAKAGHALSAA